MVYAIILFFNQWQKNKPGDFGFACGFYFIFFLAFWSDSYKENIYTFTILRKKF